MKKAFVVWIFPAAILVSLACSALNPATVPAPSPTREPTGTPSLTSTPSPSPEAPVAAATSTREEKSTATGNPERTGARVATIIPTGPGPTALSPGSLPYDEAVLDDITLIKFIANELSLSGLDRPHSPFNICYEENILSLKAGADSILNFFFLPECEFSQVADFAMSSTVIMRTELTDAACGYLFRTDGDRGSTFYMLFLQRNGAVSEWGLGYFHGSDTPVELQEPVADEHLDLSDGAQTRVLLYVRGKTIQVFFNTAPAGEITDDSLTAGGIGLLAGGFSGSVECLYDALWVNVYA